MSADQHDLETDLRTMLRTRAGDVTTVPERVFAFEKEPSAEAPTQNRWRPGPRLLAVAAAVVAVVAVAGAAIAVRDGGNDRSAPPAVSTVPSPSVTPTPTPSRIVTRKAPLSWVDLSSLPGFSIDYRLSTAGFRQVGLVRRAEGRRPVEGGTSYTNLVTVFAPGGFDAGKLDGWRTKVVNGTTMRFGMLPSIGDDGAEPALSLAFRAPSGRWVVVQGFTETSNTDAVLQAVAVAVRPESSVAQAVPFRLSYVPAGFRTDRMTLGEKSGSTVRITLASRLVDLDLYASDSVPSDHTGAVKRQVDGRTAWVDYVNGTATVQVADGVGVTVTYSAFDPSKVSRTQLRAQFDRVLDGITWHTGGDRPTAEQAIP